MREEFTRKEKEYLAALLERYAWLMNRMERHPERELHYDRKEMSALEWILGKMGMDVESMWRESVQKQRDRKRLKHLEQSIY